MSAERGPESDRASDAIFALVSAGLFLYVGFGLGLRVISDDALYNQSVTALVWGARIIGLALLAMALATFVGARVPAAADFAVSLAATALCLGIGVFWAYHDDRQGYLLALFGLVNAIGARQAWSRRQGAPRPDSPEPPESPT
jgi:hypothetical protein